MVCSLTDTPLTVHVYACLFVKRHPTPTMNQAFEFASVRKCLIFPYRENTLQIMNLVTAANIFLWRYFYFLEKQLLTYDLLAYAGQEPVLCKMHDKLDLPRLSEMGI